MPAESLKDKVMKSAMGASATDPSALDRNPNKQQILELRKGLLRLMSATEADLTAKPQVIFEKPKAAGAIFSQSPDGRWSGVIYIPEKVSKSQGLPKPSPLSNAEFRVMDTMIGLSKQPEKPVMINGTQAEVAAYRSRYDIDPKHITLHLANEAQPSPADLRQQIIEPASI